MSGFIDSETEKILRSHQCNFDLRSDSNSPDVYRIYVQNKHLFSSLCT